MTVKDRLYKKNYREMKFILLLYVKVQSTNDFWR